MPVMNSIWGGGVRKHPDFMQTTLFDAKIDKI